MATLYLDQRNLRLQIDGKALAIYHHDGTKLRSIPLALLRRVILFSNIGLDSRVMGALAEADISLVNCNARNPDRWSMLVGPAHNDAEIRLRQYRKLCDPDWRLAISRILIGIKLKRYYRFFRRVLRQRPDIRLQVTKTLETLNQCSDKVMKATSLDQLRGIEGGAARACFTAYVSLMPKSLGFTGRKRRPPPDPVNALLSLTYTLLHSRAQQTLYSAGLDPALGLIHQTQFGRASLAADLVELWRAQADQWVWRLIANRTLRAEHFRLDKGACLLDKAGRQHYYQHFESWTPGLERAMRIQVRQLINLLQDDAI